MDRELKNKTIKESQLKTRQKRKSQVCKTYDLKVNYKSLSTSQKESIKMFFVESKRVYNYILNELKTRQLNDIDYKELKNIYYYDKDRNKIDYNIQYIGSSILQNIRTSIISELTGLRQLKTKGHKVGALRFKSECNSVWFQQFGITHRIKGNRIKLQGIKRPIRVSGMDQIPDNADITTCHLIWDGESYHIKLTCFIDKDNIKTNNSSIIGIDLGLADTITLSDGSKYSISVEESERLKRLQRSLQNKVKHSNNWYKVQRKIRHEHNRIYNIKNDMANKIVHDLKDRFGTIIIQDDDLRQWSELNGSKVSHSVLGRIKSQLKRSNQTVWLDKWFPTSQHCPRCGSLHKHNLDQRTYKCPDCGYEADRDINAAKNMIIYYNQYIQWGGTLHLKTTSKISYKDFESRKPSAPLARG